MNVIKSYVDKCRVLADKIEAQQEKIATAANWFAQSILAGRVVHVFGTGHSRIMAEELWPRYGSFPG
ncbi:MAG TPA: SIS domain-containing protein, partial [Puia sp.]|nr:SIS domain-containing protein [Puia sp.]